LKRVPGGERKDSEGIIRLASLGGDGLIAKPPKQEGDTVERFDAEAKEGGEAGAVSRDGVPG
jgi:hypothetical protein